MKQQPYVGRGGEKLAFALDQLGLDVRGAVAADFGCNVGGFTDCLLQRGAQRVYAVDTGYGALEWKLRTDPRVVVMERTNAMHVSLPEPMNVIAIDVGWTKQRHILPSALKLIAPAGFILSLFKPQYEGDPRLVHRGLVSPQDFDSILGSALTELEQTGIRVRDVVRLPHEKGSKNPEAMLHIVPAACTAAREPS
jgi:23S rRNA (cytidine1920-2'-O)/16S rRNA (cytidine1409-2'-O)-methyltransferase